MNKCNEYRIHAHIPPYTKSRSLIFQENMIINRAIPFPHLSVGRTFRGQDLGGLILFRCPSLTNVYTVGSNSLSCWQHCCNASGFWNIFTPTYHNLLHVHTK